jgi:hypothetical protein
MSTGAISIVGLGICFGRDRTEGLRRELAQCQRIFTIVREPVSLWAPEDVALPPVVTLYNEYAEGVERVLNYEKAATRVLGAALQGERVCFLTYGSPSVYDRVAMLLRLRGVEAGLDVRCLSAVSSIEAILSFIGEDMAPALQVAEARWAVRSGYRIEPNAALLLTQIGAFWTDQVPLLSEAAPERLEPLRHYLSQAYEGAHPAIFVRAPVTDGDQGYLRVASIEGLVFGSQADLLGTSLFVPAAIDRERERKLWHRLRNVSVP